MWRLFRSSRRLIPSTRVASSIPSGQTVHIHRVKLARPLRVTIRKALIGGIVFYGCYTVYTTVVMSPIARWLEDEIENMTAEERKALDEPAPDLFIPFPLTTRAVQPPPYSGRDPEWREFVKLSNNRPLLEKIRADLANKVRRGAETSVLLTMKTGKPMKIRRYWLDVDFPYRPPLEYHRSGLLLTDDGIAWGMRPVDSAVVNAVNRVLWPIPLLQSTWAFAATMLKQDLQDLVRALGYESKGSSPFPASASQQGTAAGPGNPPPLPSQHHPDIQRTLQRLQQQATKRPEDIKDPRSMASQNQGAAGYTAAPPPAAAGSGRPRESSMDKPRANHGRPEDGVSGQEAGNSTLSESGKAFIEKLMKTWKHVPEQPPRGCVLVSGLIELDAPKGYIVVDVIAYWNPKTRQFDDKSMLARLRRVQPKQQSPAIR